MLALSFEAYHNSIRRAGFFVVAWCQLGATAHKSGLCVSALDNTKSGAYQRFQRSNGLAKDTSHITQTVGKDEVSSSNLDSSSS